MSVLDKFFLPSIRQSVSPLVSYSVYIKCKSKVNGFFSLFIHEITFLSGIQFDVVLILVTFLNVSYLDVLEMTGKLTAVLQKKINCVGEN